MNLEVDDEPDANIQNGDNGNSANEITQESSVADVLAGYSLPESGTQVDDGDELNLANCNDDEVKDQGDFLTRHYELVYNPQTIKGS